MDNNRAAGGADAWGAVHCGLSMYSCLLRLWWLVQLAVGHLKGYHPHRTLFNKFGNMSATRKQTSSLAGSGKNPQPILHFSCALRILGFHYGKPETLCNIC